jgi:energy-coupling factor transport system permease protein
MNRDVFYTYHPILNILFFITVITTTVFLLNPIILVLSYTAAFAYSVRLKGRKAVKFNLLYMIPLMIFAAGINVLFVHEGATILGYFNNGNPITLESIIYGIFSALMIGSVIIWFSCYNEVISSDKVIYLFGRILPKTSLIFSMILRLVPMYKAQIKIISNAQRGIGRDFRTGNLFQRARNGLKILSIMLTWALENGVETSDSMKARGYGLKGRTSFSIFRFDSRDRVLATSVGVLILVFIYGLGIGNFYFRIYPTVKWAEISPYNILFYLSIATIFFLPIIIGIMEDIKWKHLKLTH